MSFIKLWLKNFTSGTLRKASVSRYNMYKWVYALFLAMSKMFVAGVVVISFKFIFVVIEEKNHVYRQSENLCGGW